MKKELIERIEVGSGGAASIEFTGIPGTGKDLLILFSLRSTVNNATGELLINGSSANRQNITLYGTGSGVGNQNTTSAYISASQVENADTANTFSSGQLYFSNYASSSNKSFSYDSVTENNGTVAQSVIHAGLWSNTDVITALKINARTGNLTEHSTASLYKVVTE